MRSPLLKRLKTLERQQAKRSDPRRPYVRVITESEADLAQQLATLAQAGRYAPSWPVIERRIVDSPWRTLH